MFHYTYRITNTILNKHYYGTRTSKVLPKLDLGIKYFSSSSDKEFIIDQKENPKNYKYKVLYIFSTRKKAISMEIKLHNRFNVGVNESFYNRSKQTSVGFDTTGIVGSRLGIKHTEHSINLMRQIKIGKKHSIDHRQKISYGLKNSEEAKKVSNNRVGTIPWNKGKTDIYSEETKAKMGLGRKNKPHTEEHKKYMSNIMKGKNKGDNNGMKNKIIVRDLRTGIIGVVSRVEFNKNKYNEITGKGYFVGNRSKQRNFI